MSDFLNTLHNKPDTSFAQEVAAAAASEPEAPSPAPESAPEPVSHETAPEQPDREEAAPAPVQTHQDEDRRQVPLKALQEERQKRADLERRLNQLEQMFTQPQQQQAEPEPDIDPETDPIGALKRMKQEAAEMRASQQQQQYAAYLNQTYVQSAQQFAQQTPDFSDAYRYAINSRAQELEALGTPRERIGQILQHEEMSLVDQAVNNGMSPAEAIYKFAKARGYNGRAAAPAPAPAAEPAPNAELQNIKKSVATSVASGGKAASKGELTPADLLNLNGAAFDSGWQKMFRSNKSGLFRD